jgi:hypothetical protein
MKAAVASGTAPKFAGPQKSRNAVCEPAKPKLLYATTYTVVASPAQVRFRKSRSTYEDVALVSAATKPGTRRKGTPSGAVAIFVALSQRTPDCAARLVMLLLNQSAAFAARRKGVRLSV